MRLQKSDWSNFDESNDYSVGPGAAYSRRRVGQGDGVPRRDAGVGNAALGDVSQRGLSALAR